MGRSTYMVTWSTSWLTQAQPARVAASARRVLHVLRFYEALTELTTVSAALLAACDAPPSPPHTDALSMVADTASALEQCALLLGWREDDADRADDAPVAATLPRGAMVMRGYTSVCFPC